MNKKISLFLRILLTFLILGFILYKINIKELLLIYKNINFIYILVAIFFYYFAFLILSLRWKFLLLNYSKKFSINEIFKVYLLGMVVNTISPATLGVDILRSILISKKIEEGKAFAFASVLVDRLMGLIGIFSFVPVSILILKRLENPLKLMFVFISFTFLIIALLYFSWSNFFEKTFRKFISKIKFFGIDEKLLKFYNSYKIYYKYPKILFFSYFLTILLQSSFSIQAFFCAKSLGFDFSPFLFIFLVPLINALNFVPITISGIGIREAGFYVLFSYYLSPEKAVSLSFLYFLTGVFANLPFVYYFFKNPLKNEK